MVVIRIVIIGVSSVQSIAPLRTGGGKKSSGFLGAWAGVGRRLSELFWPTPQEPYGKAFPDVSRSAVPNVVRASSWALLERYSAPLKLYSVVT